jgi:hypothetical protein
MARLKRNCPFHCSRNKQLLAKHWAVFMKIQDMSEKQEIKVFIIYLTNWRGRNNVTEELNRYKRKWQSLMLRYYQSVSLSGIRKHQRQDS